jgi:hypothetical protein
MTSPFEPPTPILCRWSNEIFRPALIPFKRYSGVLKQVFEVTLHPSMGPPPNQMIPTIFDTSGNLTDLISHVKFHIDRLSNVGLAGARILYACKRGRPLHRSCLALPRLRVILILLRSLCLSVCVCACYKHYVAHAEKSHTCQ